MEKEKQEQESKEVNQNFIIVSLVVVVVFAILFCVIVYNNQIRTIHFSLEDFQIEEAENEKAILTNISKQEEWIRVDGKYFDELQSYEIYIGIENEEKDISMYKTELLKDEKMFYSIIPSKKVSENSYVKIIYMCNDEKIVINTERTVGEI